MFDLSWSGLARSSLANFRGLSPAFLASSPPSLPLVHLRLHSIATPPDVILQRPLLLSLVQLREKAYPSRSSRQNTLSCLHQSVSLVSVYTIILAFIWCANCLSSSGTVVEPVTIHLSFVTVSHQGVCAPGSFLFYLSVIADCLPVWLVVLALHVSDSVLACLIFMPGSFQACAAIWVSLLLAQEHIFVTSLFSGNVDFWSTDRLHVLIACSGAGCCFVEFCSRIALAKHATCLMGVSAVIKRAQPAACIAWSSSMSCCTPCLCFWCWQSGH